MNQVQERMNTPYYKNPSVRLEIDKVLSQNSSMFASLGVDSTQEERAIAKAVERKNLMKVRELDPFTIDALLVD